MHLFMDGESRKVWIVAYANPVDTKNVQIYLQTYLSLLIERVLFPSFVHRFVMNLCVEANVNLITLAA